MTMPTSADVNRINERCKREHIATLPGKSALQIKKAHHLYCGSREYTLLAKSRHIARTKMHIIEAEFLKMRVHAWQARLRHDDVKPVGYCRSGHPPLTAEEREELEALIKTTQARMDVSRRWLRLNKIQPATSTLHMGVRDD